MHPTQCAMFATMLFTEGVTVNYTKAFIARCIANKMNNGELAKIRNLCTSSRNLVIIRSPQAVVSTRMDDKLPTSGIAPAAVAAWGVRATAVLRSGVTPDVHRYASLLDQRHDGKPLEAPPELLARATRTVCAGHVAMDYLVRTEAAVDITAPEGLEWPEDSLSAALELLQVPNTLDAVRRGSVKMGSAFMSWPAPPADVEQIECAKS